MLHKFQSHLEGVLRSHELVPIPQMADADRVLCPDLDAVDPPLVFTSTLEPLPGARAYAEISSVNHLIAASYAFAAGLGFIFPQTAEHQFRAQQPWSVVSQYSGVMGVHYVPIIGRNAHGNLICVTWGREQVIEPPFVERYMRAAFVFT